MADSLVLYRADGSRHEPDTSVVGTLGLAHYSGEIQEEPLRELRGRGGINTYKAMANDAIVGAGLLLIRLLIRQVPWRAKPVSGGAVDQVASEYLDSCMADMTDPTWDTFIDDALSMVMFGWSAHEVLWKIRRGASSDRARHSRYSDGLVGWRGFAPRPQDSLKRWEFDDEQRLAGMTQSDPVTFEELTIPADKLLLLRVLGHKGSPEGRSILRPVYEPWFYKTQVRRFEGIGVQRDLAGTPRVTMPMEYLDPAMTGPRRTARDEVFKIAANLVRNRQAFVAIPSDCGDDGKPLFTFELMASPGARQFDTGAIIERYNKEIAIAMITDLLLIGHEAVGSFALASAKTNLLGYALAAYMDEIADAINRHVVPLLFEFNPGFRSEQGGPLTALPTVEHGDVETPDLAELGAYLSALTLTGVDLTDTETQAFLRRAAGLPERPAD
mgnify:FL=1